MGNGMERHIHKALMKKRGNMGRETRRQEHTVIHHLYMTIFFFKTNVDVSAGILSLYLPSILRKHAFVFSPNP